MHVIYIEDFYWAQLRWLISSKFMVNETEYATFMVSHENPLCTYMALTLYHIPVTTKCACVALLFM